LITVKLQSINYLAHAYLSFNNPGILVGNMISDFVKGKKQFEYSSIIHKGIQLHRFIDSFTDAHEVTRQMKAFFRPQYRLYAGAFADVAYDHFLATDTREFECPEKLQQFAASVYTVLQQQRDTMPEPFAKMIPWMAQQDWLTNYRFTTGIEKSFGGLVRRSAYLTESAVAFDVFMANYDAMKQCYDNFFPELKKETFYQLQRLLKI
jgi:acyl carrier protein phosphodiesterase